MQDRRTDFRMTAAQSIFNFAVRLPDEKSKKEKLFAVRLRLINN